MIKSFTNILLIVGYFSVILTVNLLFDWCIGMKHAQRMYKFLKLNNPILLLIEQIKNLQTIIYITINFHLQQVQETIEKAIPYLHLPYQERGSHHMELEKSLVEALPKNPKKFQYSHTH